MGRWRKGWYALTSFLICAAVIVLGTLLYPLFFLFFAGIALLYPLYRRIRPAADGPRGRAPEGEAGR